MAKIIWGEDTLSDLEVIYDYIARDSPRYARQQVERIGNAVERLYQSPESGRRLPDFPQLPHREVVVGNYRVVYRYDPERDVVNIVMVVHGARLLKKPPDQDEHP